MVQAGAGPPSGQQRSPAKEAQPKGGLIVEAREYLRQIRAQQSNTKTVGATLSTPGNIAGASGQYATTSTELARTYPELVRTFVSFLGKVASELHGPEKPEDADGMDSPGSEQPRGCMVIGIDELDKISGAEQAQRFVNELKAILGVPHCYYLISVSDDALAAYEMRGLPVRDAFDSAFDEVIHVRYLDLEGSLRLLKKRVLMPDPFVWLCHCLSGGLPRDLIRAARHVVIAAGRKPASDTDPSGTNYLNAVCEQLVLEELRRKLDVCWINRPAGRLERADSELLHAIQRLVAYQPGTDEQRIRCDLVTGRALRTELECIVADLTPDDLEPGGPPPGNAAPQVPAPQVPAPQAPAPGVPATAGAQEPPAVPELASYLHYLLALLEVFTQPPSPEGTIMDAKGNPVSEALLDQLCLARQTLGVDPRWAWLTIEDFRGKVAAGRAVPVSRRRGRRAGRLNISVACSTRTQTPRPPRISAARMYRPARWTAPFLDTIRSTSIAAPGSAGAWAAVRRGGRRWRPGRSGPRRTGGSGRS